MTQRQNYLEPLHRPVKNHVRKFRKGLEQACPTYRWLVLVPDMDQFDREVADVHAKANWGANEHQLTDEDRWALAEMVERRSKEISAARRAAIVRYQAAVTRRQRAAERARNKTQAYDEWVEEWSEVA